MIASRNGGYFPTTWGWAALLLAWFVVVAVVALAEVVVTPYEVAFVGGLSAFGGWTWLSALWSRSVPATVFEGERMLVYAAGVAALAVVVRRLTAAAILGGILGGLTAVCAYSLATRLFPRHIGTFDPVSSYRLSSPVGYWNALGLLAAVGSLLAVGFVARGRSPAARGAAAAALVVLLPTMYFTFSRGAWLSLAVSLVLLIAFDPRRLQACSALIVAAPAPTAAVLVASHSPALTTLGARLGVAAHEGHRLALVVAILAVTTAAFGASFGHLETRVAVGRRVRRGLPAVLILVAAAVVAVAVVHWGSPWHVAARGWNAFASASPSTGPNLNNRLFHLSNNGRIVSWKSAVHQFEQAPLAGQGAGTFETWWLAHRSAPQQIRDAHSLYLETLGELGIVGAVLLVGTLLIALVAAWRRRGEPLIPFAAAALVAWIVHAGVDWDWEIPAVTLPALACAVVCTAGAGRRVEVGRTARGAVAAVALAAACFAFVAAIGNQAAASADTALGQQNYGKAEQQAVRAARWAPWSSEPWIVRGQLDARNEDPAAARKSFETAIAKDPRNYLAWYGLAGVEAGAARRQAAARVVALNPLSDEAAEMRKILSRRP